MPNNGPDVPGPIAGATSTSLQAGDFSNLPPDWQPQYAGPGAQPGRGGMAGYFGGQMGKNPYRRQVDPYMDQWAHQAQGQQLSDRDQLSDLYAQLNAQAHGAVTPQQQQQLSGMMTASMNQQGMANGAVGGARARAAAMGGLTQQSGIQGMQNAQNVSMQQASDKIGAIQQMQQVSAMQRANDLQAQDLTAEDAQRQAQLEVQARGLNIQHELGYAGLESGAVGNDYQAFIDAYRRQAQKKNTDQAQRQALASTITSTAANTIGAASAGA